MHSMSTTEERPYTFQDLLAVVLRWRRLAAIVFVAFLVPGVLVTMLMPPTYEAVATLAVSRNVHTPEYTVKPGNPELSGVYRTLDRKEEINGKIEFLKSRAIMESVIDDLGVDETALDRIRDVRRYVRAIYKWVKSTAGTIYDETKYFLHLSQRPTKEEMALLAREKLVANAQDRLLVNNVPDSGILEVKFRSSDPMLAARIVNLICDKFVGRDSKSRDALAHGYFVEESEKRAEQLRQAESSLEKARESAVAYSIDDQRRLILNAMVETGNRAKSVHASRAGLAARVDALAAQLQAEPERVQSRTELNRNPAMDQVHKEVVGLEIQRSSASQQFLPESPIVQDLDSRILATRRLQSDIQPRIDGQVTVELNPVREALRQKLMADRAELAALRAEEEALVNQSRDYRIQLAKLSHSELMLKDLTRDVKEKEEGYSISVRNRQQAQLTEGMASASLAEVGIVDHASLPLSPIRPRRWLWLGIALAGALLAALIAPFLAEYNVRTFTSEEDVRRRIGNLVVVASFPARSRADGTG